jgi:hypothetical protein
MSLVALPLFYLFGIDPLALTINGGLILLPVLWFLFFRWNVRV